MTLFLVTLVAMLPGWWIFILFAEYWSHRLVMHLPFHPHRKRHHEAHCDYPVWFHVDLPVYYHLFVASPMFWMHWKAWAGTSMMFGDSFKGSVVVIGSAASLLVLLCWHSYMWSRLHRAFHKIEYHNWTKETVWYDALLDHHISHHRHPEFNFGVMSDCFDRLFHTKWKEV